jgi:hypothetical protein
VIDSKAAWTAEWLFQYDDSTPNYSYPLTKYNTYVQYQNGVLVVNRRSTGSNPQDIWTATTMPAFTDGAWYDVQLSLGAFGTMPLLKINNVTYSLSGMPGDGTTAQNDSAYPLKICNNDAQGSAFRCNLAVFRWYDAPLTTAELSANYAVDWARIASSVGWTQDGTTYKVPNVAADDLTLESIVGLDNAWHEGYPEPNVGAVATDPVVVVAHTEPVGGNATARAYNPSVIAARFPDVPPQATLDLTHPVRANFVFNPILGED